MTGRGLALSAVALLLILLHTFQPFLPGRYDPLAVPLSSMMQAIGICGLILVPLAIAWMLVDRTPERGTRRKLVARRTLLAGIAVLMIVALVGFIRDILRLSPNALALERTRGHFRVLDGPLPGWKYFQFD